MDVAVDAIVATIADVTTDAIAVVEKNIIIITMDVVADIVINISNNRCINQFSRNRIDI